MKTIRTKFLSLLLALVTILSLLPTSAFAAAKTGSGIQITQNQAYWSTRLLANGTPYSYRPPLVDGKLVYCMDSGLGYHYATPSYLNSFTWTSGTGADADAVLQSALTNSGLSEMDAATVENVKWMMTYLNDCKESNVGQLFMRCAMKDIPIWHRMSFSSAAMKNRMMRFWVQQSSTTMLWKLTTVSSLPFSTKRSMAMSFYSRLMPRLPRRISGRKLIEGNCKKLQQLPIFL